MPITKERVGTGLVDGTDVRLEHRSSNGGGRVDLNSVQINNQHGQDEYHGALSPQSHVRRPPDVNFWNHFTFNLSRRVKRRGGAYFLASIRSRGNDDGRLVFLGAERIFAKVYNGP